uniref:Si:ch73-138n13.1 n=1 Tax=Scleropages formosus TaxID=113540 RepID=A0A8C9U3R3_SCLFO
MATQVEVKSGEAGRATGLGGRLRLSPLADFGNKSSVEPLSESQRPLILAPDPTKPVPGPKPRLTPKPFAVEKNTGVKPILAPKPHAKPRSEPTGPGPHKPEPPSTPKPSFSPASTANRPTTTTFKPALQPNLRHAPKPAPTPPSGELGKTTPPDAVSALGVGAQPPQTKSSQVPRSAEWAGSTDPEGTGRRPEGRQRPIVRAKSMGFLSQLGQDGVAGELESRGDPAAERVAPLRAQSRGAKPRPVSAVFLPAETQPAPPVSAPRWVGRRPLSAALTARFESIGLSQQRKADAPEKVLQEDSGLDGKMGKGAEPLQSSGTEERLSLSGPERRTEEKDKEGTRSGDGMKRLCPSSPAARPPSPVEAEPRSPGQPTSETDVPVGVKQRIKKLTEDIPSSQAPPPRPPFKPRPLHPDLTKRFAAEKPEDVSGSPPRPWGREGRRSSGAREGSAQEKVEEFAVHQPMEREGMGVVLQSPSDHPGQIFLEQSPEGANSGLEGGRHVESRTPEPCPGRTVQTVRAALFENVVERHSVQLVEPAARPWRSLSFHQKGTDPPLAPCPVRVEHVFDTVPAVGERRVTSERIPAAQLEEKAMTLRSRHSGDGVLPRTNPTEEVSGPVQGPVVSQVEARVLRVGALQRWATVETSREAHRDVDHELVVERKKQMEMEREKQRQIELERETLRQIELKKQKQVEMEKERQKQIEKERKRQIEMEEERLRQIELERWRQVELEKEKKRQIELERERLRQIELEKQKLVEMEKERQREMERQRIAVELEKERKKQMEMEKERKRQIELERERLRFIEIEKQRQVELEKERLEKERQRQVELEKERQRQVELEKERQRQVELEKERQRQVELEKERQRQVELEKERQRQVELEKERQRQVELEKERQRQAELEKERQRKAEWLKQMEPDREEAGAPKRLKMLEGEDQLSRPRATFFALTGQIQDFPPQGNAVQGRPAGVELPVDDFFVTSGRLDSHPQVVPLQRNPSLNVAPHKNIGPRWMGGVGGETVSDVSWGRDREKEQESQREKVLELQRHIMEETEKQRQREAELEMEMERHMERQEEAQKRKGRQQIQELDRRCQVQIESEQERAPISPRRLDWEQPWVAGNQEERSEALRPRVLDLDSMLLMDRQWTGTPAGDWWKQPTQKPNKPYHMAILDIDSFRSQVHLAAPTAAFASEDNRGMDLGDGNGTQVCMLKPEDGQGSVPARTTGRSASTRSPQQDFWEPMEGKAAGTPLGHSKLAGYWVTPESPPKAPPKPLLHPEKRWSSPSLSPDKHWAGLPAEAGTRNPSAKAELPKTRTIEGLRPGHGTASVPERLWRAQEQGPERRDQWRKLNTHTQELSRMRSRSVSRRAAPSENTTEGSLSRMRSRSAHRERDQQSWEQLKKCVTGEREGRDTDTLVHETDSQYGTWETGLRTEDSLTPATPTSDSNLSSSPRKPTPPHTPSDPDTPDAPTPSSHPEGEPLPFPETATTLLDSSALRSRVQLSKRRSRRTLPSRAARHSATLSMLDEGSGDPVQDWMYCDSTEQKAEPTNEEDSDVEDQPGAVEPRPVSSQQQRVALFPGMDPSALKAQLRKRGDSDSQTDGLAPSPSQQSRSPKSPFLPRASRVLPPAGGKENGEEASPQWLKELKSKKRLSQYDSSST